MGPKVASKPTYNVGPEVASNSKANLRSTDEDVQVTRNSLCVSFWIRDKQQTYLSAHKEDLSLCSTKLEPNFIVIEEKTIMSVFSQIL